MSDDPRTLTPNQIDAMSGPLEGDVRLLRGLAMIFNRNGQTAVAEEIEMMASRYEWARKKWDAGEEPPPPPSWWARFWRFT